MDRALRQVSSYLVLCARATWAALRRPAWQRRLSWAGAGFYGLLLIFVAILVYRERAVIYQYLLTADLSMLLVVAFWYMLDLLICMAGWILILKQLGDSSRLVDHVRIYCLANASRRLPGTLWYIGGRAVLYERIGTGPQIVLLASGLEAIMMLISGALLAVPVLALILPGLLWLWLTIAGIVLLVVLNPVVLRRILARSVHGWTTTKVRVGHVYGWLAVYALAWVLGGIVLFSVLRIFEPVPFWRLPYVTGSWTLAGTVSYLMLFLPSNFGVTETSLIVLLTPVVSAAVAALAAVSIRIIVTLLDLLVGGAAGLLFRLFNPR
jgi:glycosyltransferase 2 family protein